MKKVSSEIAYEYIRRRILSGDFPPGFSLTADYLSKELGVSRTPIRDALLKLEADGLVSISPRIGATVKQMDIHEIGEMCELRLALESHAAGRAAELRSAEDLHEIELAISALRRLTEESRGHLPDPVVLSELARYDVRFHIAIISAARNYLMKKQILGLHLINRVVTGVPDVSDPPLSPEEREARRLAVLMSHEEIFAAIVQREPEAARRAMRCHIQGIIDRNMQRMMQAAAGAGILRREILVDELCYDA